MLRTGVTGGVSGYWWVRGRVCCFCLGGWGGGARGLGLGVLVEGVGVRSTGVAIARNTHTGTRVMPFFAGVDLTTCKHG
jgi:hypothetical protein